MWIIKYYDLITYPVRKKESDKMMYIVIFKMRLPAGVLAWNVIWIHTDFLSPVLLFCSRPARRPPGNLHIKKKIISGKYTGRVIASRCRKRSAVRCLLLTRIARNAIQKQNVQRGRHLRTLLKNTRPTGYISKCWPRRSFMVVMVPGAGLWWHPTLIWRRKMRRLWLSISCRWNELEVRS